MVKRGTESPAVASVEAHNIDPSTVVPPPEKKQKLDETEPGAEEKEVPDDVVEKPVAEKEPGTEKTAEEDTVYKKDEEMKVGKRVIVFDFDQTISQMHVFKCLAGFIGPAQGNFLQPPYALTERGQIRKSIEADKEMKGKFFSHCLGGDKQIEFLDAAFTQLRKDGVDLYVCSKGLVGPIRLILERTKLLGHFLEVYGRLDDYAREGCVYDDEAAAMKFGKEIDTHVGRADMAKWNNKAELCHRLAAGRPIMLVEDDKDEIARARKAGLDTCFVAKRTGMHQEEVDILLGWANK